MACVGTDQVCATATLFSGGTTKMVPLQCWRRTIVSPPTCRRGRWVVFLTACTVALGACATSGPTRTTSVATQLSVTPCVETTPATLLACGALVQAGRADVIEVQGRVICSGPAACELRIENAPRPFVIRGAAGSLIRREDHYDYELLAAVGPADATFQDLVIDERADAPCQAILPVDPPVENPDCKSTIFVFGADHVAVKNVTVAHAKSQAVLIARA